MRGLVTIEDIGRELGISAMTVSRALNGHPHVKEETREKVLSLAARLNYRPNRWARSLATQKSHLIGIVVPDISHSFFSEITRAVQDSIEPFGYDLMLCHSSGDPERERTAIETLLGSRVEGLMVASSRRADDPGIFAELKTGSTPFVLLDRYFDDLECPRVHADDFLVGRLAAEHLLALGHTKIAYIRGPEVTNARERLAGFVSALEEHSVQQRSEWLVHGDFGLDSGYDAMRVLLEGRERPTAVGAANDPSAVGAIQACREAGLEVPGDISIIGAGMIEGRYYPNPFLTTVDWSRRELGEQAARLLLDAILGRESAGELEWICAPTLVVRQSTSSAQCSLAGTVPVV
jgi:DNA-binding LacI/PurR family transcriptional regulator